MRTPHYFFWGNLVLRTPTDAWAVYELDGPELPGALRAAQDRGRRAPRGARLHDRVRLPDPPRLPAPSTPTPTRAGRWRRSTPATATRERFAEHLAEHTAALRAPRGAAARDLPRGAPRAGPGGRAPRRRARGGGRGLARARLAARLRGARAASRGRADRGAPRRLEEKVHDRVLGYLDCERVGARRLATLIRRAYTRGLGEPDTDEGFAPQALSFLDADGEERFEPYGHDLLRLHESRVHDRAALAGDRLRARPRSPGPARSRRDARGNGGARPRGRADVRAAGARLRRSTPRSRSSSSSTARPAGRSPSARSTPTRSRDEEAAGAHGPSVEGAERPAAARELEAVLGGGDRPPLLRTRAAPLRRRARGGRAGGAGRAPARELRPGAAAPPRRRAAPPLPGLAAGGHLPAARVQGAPAARPGRGDGPARDQPRRIADRALYRPHPDRLAPAGPVRPRRGLPAEPAADRLLAVGSLGSGKTSFQQFVRLAGIPAGLADRRHRPQGRPPSARACPGSPSGWRRSISRAPSATAACSTRCGSRPRRPARTSPTASSSRSCRRRSRRSGRRSCASPSPRRSAPAPATPPRCCGGSRPQTTPTRGAVGKAVEVHASGLARLGLGDAEAEPPEVGGAQVVSLRIAQPDAAAAGDAPAPSCSRRSGSASRCCACSLPTHCDSAQPTPDRHAVLPMDEVSVLTADSQGQTPA